MKSTYFSLFFLLLVSVGTLQAQGPVAMRCANILPNGNIQITWVNPTPNVGLIFRAIYKDGVNIATINIDTVTTFLDTQGDGNQQSHIFDIISSYLPIQVFQSNYISTIFLTSVNNISNANPGQATLTWNALPLQSSSGNYTAYSDYQTGNMAQLGNFWPNLNATETITDCQHTIHHQIVVSDASGCVSNSNITTGVFSQLGNVVANPDLRCVSVLPNGNVQLSWLTPSGSSTDFNNYKIKRNNVIIDSVGVFPQTSFVDAGINANNFKYDYTVVSNSGCSGSNAGSNSTNTLSSIHLVTSTPSSSSVQVDWNTMPLLPSAGFYEVNRDLGSGYVLINNTLNLTYLDAGIPGPATATYRISVNDMSGCTSRSNISNPILITSLNTPLTNHQAVNLFPNPAGSKIFFSKEVRDVSIYDAIGKCVWTQPNPIAELDISNLKKGRYTLKAKVNHQFTVLNFIIE